MCPSPRPCAKCPTGVSSFSASENPDYSFHFGDEEIRALGRVTIMSESHRKENASELTENRGD